METRGTMRERIERLRVALAVVMARWIGGPAVRHSWSVLVIFRWAVAQD